MSVCVYSAQLQDLHAHSTVETSNTEFLGFLPQSDVHLTEEHSPVVPIVADPCHKLGKQVKEDDKAHTSVAQVHRKPPAAKSIRSRTHYRWEPYYFSRCFRLALASHGAAHKRTLHLPRALREAGRFVAMRLTGGYVPNHSPCLRKDSKKQPAVPVHSRRLMLGTLSALLGDKQKDLLTLRGDRFVEGTSDYKTAAQGVWYFEVSSAEAAERLEAFSGLVRLVVPAEGESCLVLEPVMSPMASLSAVRVALPPAGFLGATDMRFERL